MEKDEFGTLCITHLDEENLGTPGIVSITSQTVSLVHELRFKTSFSKHCSDHNPLKVTVAIG